MIKLYVFVLLLLFPTVGAAKHVETFDLRDIKPGQFKIISWQKTPILVYHRTEQQIQNIKTSNSRAEFNVVSLYNYARRYSNELANSLLHGERFNGKKSRSFNDRWFVALGGSPEFGVLLRVDPVNGLIINPMTGNHYDLTGRSLDVNAVDLSIPNYEIVDRLLTFVEIDQENIIDFSPFDGRVALSSDELAVAALNWNRSSIASELLEKYPELIENEEVILAIWAYTLAYDDIEFLKEVIARGIKVNVVLRNNITPFGDAIFQDKIEFAKILLANGAKSERVCYQGRCSTSIVELAKTNKKIASVLKRANDSAVK